MNEISWLVYWADVLPSLARGVGLVFTLGFIAAFGVSVVHLIYRPDYMKYNMAQTRLEEWKKRRDLDPNLKEDSPDDGWRYRDEASIAASTRFALWLFPLCLLISLSTNFIPSRETFFLIAGSEIGEQAVQTEEFTKVRKVINNWLDEQVAENEEEERK